MDVIVSVAGLLILLPLYPLVAVCIRCFVGGPVIFKQKRPGLSGKPFTLYKLRTMKDDRDPEGHLLPDEKRVSRFGGFLRSLSLDEAPELWNVLRGDMSLVGPRPLLMEYLPLYTDEQRRRHDVKPGITGWAQVNGRNAISWEEKFECDVWYVDHWSLGLDIKIIIMTFSAVLQRKGISAKNHSTMPMFTGKDRDLR